MAMDKLFIIGAVVLVGLLFLGGGLSGVGDFFSVAPQEVAPAPGAGVADCQVEDTTLTLRAYDIENKGTATGETHSVWVNGQFTGTVADAGTTTVSPGDSLMILFGNSSESAEGGWYSVQKSETVGCVGTKTMTAFQKDRNSSALTMTYLNSDDESANSASDLQAVASGGEEVGILKLQGSSEDYYGTENMLIVLEGTNSVYEELKVEGATKVSIPSFYNPASNERAWAYEVSGLVGSKRDNFDIVIKAKDGQNPTSANNITVTLYDDSLYIDAETNTVAGPAYEDELGNELGTSSQTVDILIS